MTNILLVDDSIIVVPMSLIFSGNGHNVVTAKNGIEGLEVLRQRSDIEIILLDHDMPKMNGYEFSKEVKTNEKYNGYSEIPILGIGSFPEDKREYLDGILSKGSPDEQFEAAFIKYLNQHKL